MIMTIRSNILALAIVCAAIGCAPRLVSGSVSPIVTVAEGKLKGVVVDSVQAFLGIPYAAPPVGTQRWRSPAPAERWIGERDSTTFGPSCMQSVKPTGFGPWSLEYLVQGQVSEDCLFLNVWTPAMPRVPTLPVMVWIHGGGFSAGSGSVPIYDGAALARHGIIVVTINYRLGAFGYLAHPALTAEGGSSGNYAVQDMIAALRWVRANIAAFGGDPQQVTIAGQSAGAASVHQLISAPAAKGLFARAIAQSGSGMGVSMPELAEGERRGLVLADKAGASTLQLLREVPAKELLRLGAQMQAEGMRLLPIVDGQVLPHTLDSLPEGAYTDTPVLTGLNSDEGSAMTPGYGLDSSAQFSERLVTVFGRYATAASRLYPHTNDSQARQSVKTLIRERGVAAALLWARNREAQGGKYPVYLYLFSHPEPGQEAEKYGAFHSAEIPYVFQTLNKSPERAFTASDQRLSNTMSAYWVNFIRSGDPNGTDLPRWPVLDPSDPYLLRFTGEDTTVQLALPKEKWDLFFSYAQSGGKLGLF